MALTRTNIIGRITLPDDTNPVNSVVRFVMTGFDTDATENATIIQIPIDAAIDALGDIDVDLWPNPLGVRSTFYATYVRIPDGNTNDVINVYVGQISVPATGGPYDLNDLLPIAPPAGADVADYIAQLAAAVASTEAAAAQAALDAAQTALDAAATAADVVTSTGLLADATAANEAAIALVNSAGAYADTTIAAAIAAAEAALIVGDFYTATGDDVTYVALFEIETGPVSTELYRFAKKSYIDALPFLTNSISIYNIDGIALGEYYADRIALFAGSITTIAASVIAGGVGSWVDFYLEVGGVTVSGPHRAEFGIDLNVTGLSEAVAIGDDVSFSITAASTASLVTEVQIKTLGVLS